MADPDGWIITLNNTECPYLYMGRGCMELHKKCHWRGCPKRIKDNQREQDD